MCAQRQASQWIIMMVMPMQRTVLTMAKENPIEVCQRWKSLYRRTSLSILTSRSTRTKRISSPTSESPFSPCMLRSCSQGRTVITSGQNQPFVMPLEKGKAMYRRAIITGALSYISQPAPTAVDTGKATLKFTTISMQKMQSMNLSSTHTTNPGSEMRATSNGNSTAVCRSARTTMTSQVSIRGFSSGTIVYAPSRQRWKQVLPASARLKRVARRVPRLKGFGTSVSGGSSGGSCGMGE
mmetsp:Transcript_10732/g.31470  ORF Transcript_10732/g.31470 Transcript_10732/m.31470 type:complete len:239 (-) Transcript_10732:46-762(-)